MRCNVEPYEGSRPFIFVSYSHKDKAQVYPYIEMLARDGYRIWYDEGITPGDEWTENIANHLERCSVFVAFITEASLNSHNCRREINFAVQKEKNLVTLFLERVRLSAGMEMMLADKQGIFRDNYSLADEFISKLTRTEGLEECRGEARADIRVEERIDTEDKTMTLTQTQTVDPMKPDASETFLFYVATGERVYITKSSFGIGRSKFHSDFVIPGKPYVGRRHMTIRRFADNYSVTDNRSLNHVGINGRRIPPEVESPISNYDLISFATEHMVFFQDYDDSFLKSTPDLMLRDLRETWTVDRSPVVRIGNCPVDRNGKGNELCPQGGGISESHALIIRTMKGAQIVDISGKGQTMIDGASLRYGERTVLKPGSILTIGERSFEIVSRI